MDDRRDRRLALFVLLVSFVVYNANLRLIATGDSFPAGFLPFALWAHGTVYLDPVLEATIQRHPEPYWVQPTVNGHSASLFSIVTPVLVAPLYLPAVLSRPAVSSSSAPTPTGTPRSSTSRKRTPAPPTSSSPWPRTARSPWPQGFGDAHLILDVSGYFLPAW